jgi:hypothetical protein
MLRPLLSSASRTMHNRTSSSEKRADEGWSVESDGAGDNAVRCVSAIGLMGLSVAVQHREGQYYRRPARQGNDRAVTICHDLFNAYRIGRLPLFHGREIERDVRTGVVLRRQRDRPPMLLHNRLRHRET